MDIEKIKIGFSIVGGFIAAIKLVPSIYKFTRRVTVGIATIETISAQFQNNGGSTLKDVVDDLRELMLIERERNRAVSTLLPAGMFEMDCNGLCTWISSKYTDITGCVFEDVQGWNWTSKIHESDRARVIAEWNQAVVQERRMIITYRLTDSNNHILIETFPVHDENKCIAHIGLACILR